MANCAAAQASPPHPTPTAGQAFSLLTHIPCYSQATAASHHSRTNQPSCSPPRGHPLSRLPWLRVIPILGLSIVHLLGALDVAWSTWSMDGSHWKRTVRGEADSWTHQLHLRTQGSASLLCAKKSFIHMAAGTHQLYLRTQGSTSLSSLTARTHQVEACVTLFVSSRIFMYILVDRSLCKDELWLSK